MKHWFRALTTPGNPGGAGDDQPASRRPRRRRAIGLASLAVAALLAGDIYVETHYPVRVERSLASSKLAAGSTLRVLHLSDIHGQTFTEAQGLMALVREARPDMIALTGDVLDHHTKTLEPMWDMVDQLRAICPAIYYVTGNHEWWHPGRAAFVAGLVERGVVAVNNRHEVFRKGGLTVNVCGVDDAYTGHDDLDRALAGVAPAHFTLLLSHSPAPARRLAGTPVDLMLAGHTHGGQIRLPFIGAVVAPGEGFFPAFDKGLYPLGHEQFLYIDSGLGTSIVPIRLFNRSQLSLLVIAGRS